MPRFNTTQGPGSEDTNADHSHLLLLGLGQETVEVLGGEASRNLNPSAGVEQIVADLHSIEGRSGNHLVHGRGLAESRDAAKAGLPLALQCLQGRDNAAEHVLDAEPTGISAALQGNMVMELQEIDMVQAEALQTGVE
jgi:hypothetical protein